MQAELAYTYKFGSFQWILLLCRHNTPVNTSSTITFNQGWPQVHLDGSRVGVGPWRSPMEVWVECRHVIMSL